MRMSNQEAIEVIKLAQAQVEWDYPMDYAVAFDMAISALEAQDAPDTNVDTISRQAAIDTDGLDEEIRCEMCRNPMHTNRGCDGNCRYDEKLYKKILQILDKRIKPLPSAQTDLTAEEWALIKQLRSYHNGSYARVLDRLIAAASQPAIIHCRDCKHYYFADNRIPQEQRYTCDLDGHRWSADSFCSFAERREDED